MKKTTEYQPLFSDILEDQEKLDADKVSDPEDKRGSTYLGVT